MNRPMGGWLLSYNVTMADRPTACPFSFFLWQMRKKKNTSFLIKHPYRPHIFPHAHSFVREFFFPSQNLLWNSFRWEPQFSSFRSRVLSVFSSGYISLQLDLFSKQSPGRAALPAFNLPPCDKTQRGTLSQGTEESDSWIFSRWRIEGGGGGGI